VPKALIAGIHGQSMANAEEWNLGARFNSTTESSSQYSVTEDASFTGLRGTISGGGSGTNTFRIRDNAGNGQNVVAITGTGTGEDTTNTDTLQAGDLINGSYTDTGTNSTVRTWALNVEFASGHGNFHTFSAPAADTVADGYMPIHGSDSGSGSSAATPDTVQFEVREYTSLEAFQVRVVVNPNVNDTNFSVNVNGVDVGTGITYAAGVTGLQVVTGMGLSLSPGDLVCIHAANNGGLAPTFIFFGATLKSTDNSSAHGYSSLVGTVFDESDPVSYLSFGQGVVTVESSAAIKVGFAARCASLRGYLSENAQDGATTLKLFVNGSAVLTATIAAGVTGWFRNLIDFSDITDTDLVSLELAVAGVGAVRLHQALISFEPIPDGGGEGGDPGVTPEPLKYGLPGLPRRDYESQVRAHWERIEAAERAEQARRERVAELQRQQAEVDAKAARASRSSAVAKRKAKLAREIEALQAEHERAADEVAEIRELIAALEAEIAQMAADAAALVDRRRRMMLVLATVA
jgi:hypothetical protein